VSEKWTRERYFEHIETFNRTGKTKRLRAWFVVGGCGFVVAGVLIINNQPFYSPKALNDGPDETLKVATSTTLDKSESPTTTLIPKTAEISPSITTVTTLSPNANYPESTTPEMPAIIPSTTAPQVPVAVSRTFAVNDWKSKVNPLLASIHSQYVSGASINTLQALHDRLLPYFDSVSNGTQGLPENVALYADYLGFWTDIDLCLSFGGSIYCNGVETTFSILQSDIANYS